MKIKTLAIIGVLTLSILLTACGKSNAVMNVEAEIGSIGDVTVDSGADIKKAAADYDALSNREKKHVENKELLDSAKEKYSVIEQFVDVADGYTWYFNGGNDTTLNSIRFTSDSAVISQVSFDGNGNHYNGSKNYNYTVDAENVSVTLADGSNLVIPYKINEKTVAIGNGEYYTIEQIDAAIQGCWNIRVSNSILGMRTVSDYSILFANGTVVSEKASLAYGGTNGEYYYYGPYQGTYKLNNMGGLDTDMSCNNEWFFNIIDGKAVIIHYDSVCSPSAGLPGENGYSFM